jgi:hypothetical protein
MSTLTLRVGLQLNEEKLEPDWAIRLSTRRCGAALGQYNGDKVGFDGSTL